MTIEHLLQKLEQSDASFKEVHLGVLDLIDEAEQEDEQAVLDEHDDMVADTIAHIQQLLAVIPKPEHLSSDSDRELRRQLQERLDKVEAKLQVVVAATGPMATGPNPDNCLLRQYEEQIAGFKSELADISRSIISIKGGDKNLSGREISLDRCIFDVCLKIKRILEANKPVPLPPAPTPVVVQAPPQASGIKLPKIDVPTFDGNMLHWASFWEQFQVSVHGKDRLSVAEKLAYLRHAVKDGPAKYVIEGLTGSGNNYAEAVECLKRQYNRPRLLHEIHVKAIVEAQTLKDGTGKELRRLHDCLVQHLRALTAMGYGPSASFITALIQLKLDQNTRFEWQRYTQGVKKVPHYDDMLAFLDMRAQASETLVR